MSRQRLVFTGLIALVALALVFQLTTVLFLHGQRPGEALPGLDMNAGLSTLSDTNSYDVVTTVHHDDLGPFVEYGLASWDEHLTDWAPDRRLFAIATPQALERLQTLKRYHQADDPSTPWNRLVLISETVCPFTIQDAKFSGAKKSWVFQQLLKLYSYRVLKEQTAEGSTISPQFLLLDSDTVLVKSLPMMLQGKGNKQKRLFINIASESSGAFTNDVMAGSGILRELFGADFPAAFPNYPPKERFTAITHHMMMDGAILEELLVALEQQFDQPAWQRLGQLKDSFLTEWELYSAYVMAYHRDSIAIRQLSYVNWGRMDDESLHIAKQRDVSYVTRHDDWAQSNICCVNSVDWTDKDPTFPCACCSGEVCEHTRIDCSIMAVANATCVDHEADEQGSPAHPYMTFE
jgi:hypothetical protein